MWTEISNESSSGHNIVQHGSAPVDGGGFRRGVEGGRTTNCFFENVPPGLGRFIAKKMAGFNKRQATTREPLISLALLLYEPDGENCVERHDLR
jgi:hypothetical protein